MATWSIPIGKTYRGRKMYHNINRIPHSKVAGATGSGKTEFLKYLTLWLCMNNSPREAEFIIIDLKNGVSFAEFKWFPHVSAICSTVKDAVKGITKAHETMKARLEEVASRRAYFDAEPNYSRLIVLIDEGGELAPANAIDTDEKKLRGEAMDLLSSIARIGREPRVNIIYGTQRPDNDTLPVAIRGQLEGVFCFRTENELDSNIVLRHTGAEKLQWIPGRYLYKSPMVKHAIEIQSPYVPKDVIKKIVQPLIKGTAPSVRTDTAQSVGESSVDGQHDITELIGDE